MVPLFLQPPYRHTALWIVALTGLVLFFLLGFSRATHLDSVLREERLRVVVLEDPRHINVGQDRFTTALIDGFATHLGVQLHIQTVPDYSELVRALELGFADLAAGGLISAATSPNLEFSEPFMTVVPQVVSSRGNAIEQSEISDYQGAVRADSPLTRALDGELPETVVSIAGTTDEVLSELESESMDYAVIDSSDYAFYRPYFPGLRHNFDLTEEQPVGWAFHAREDGTLREAANAFINEWEASGQLEVVRDQYFGHLREFDYVGVRRFERHVESRLPALEDLFRSAAAENGIDWRLLAAQGYQESHWEPDAISPTGVRGIMMLTLPTAGDLGISNRLDPEQSINGGARYLADLRERVPESVTEPDRTWYALAAYNVGMGHLMDAMRIAEALDMPSNYWTDLREILPRLRDPDYYRFTRYGFARGEEPVIYVQNIRRYYDLLRWMFPTEEESETDMPGLQPESPSFSLPSLI